MHADFFFSTRWRTLKYSQSSFIVVKWNWIGYRIVCLIFFSHVYCTHFRCPLAQDVFDRERFVLFQGTKDPRRGRAIGAAIGSPVNTPVRIQTVEACSLGRGTWPVICVTNAVRIRGSSVLTATTCARWRPIYASTSRSSIRTTTSTWLIFFNRGKLFDKVVCYRRSKQCRGKPASRFEIHERDARGLVDDGN